MKMYELSAQQKHYVEYNCRVICLIRVSSTSGGMYNTMSTIYNVYKVPHNCEHRYTGWENILTRMSHQDSGTYLGVKVIHPRYPDQL